MAALAGVNADPQERLGLTDVKRAANRVNFNQPEEEIIDGDDIIGTHSIVYCLDAIMWPALLWCIYDMMVHCCHQPLSLPVGQHPVGQHGVQRRASTGLGLLGSKEGSGRLRVQAQQQKQKLSAKTMKKHKNRMSGLQTSGMLFYHDAKASR